MKIYRTTIYRGETLWSTRICTSRRQWAQLKQDFGHIGITKMALERFEIPDHLWVPDQELPEPVGQTQSPFSVDEEREKLGLVPWGLPETSEPIVMTTQGPIPIFEATEIIRERILRQTGRNPGKTEEE